MCKGVYLREYLNCHESFFPIRGARSRVGTHLLNDVRGSDVPE